MLRSRVLANKVKVSFLDLRGSGISAIERLCLEESLLRHDSRNWVVVGTHEPVSNRFLTNVSEPEYIRTSEDRNQSCLVIMGIGGKPDELLNVSSVKEDGVLVVKRFSGGGTVVVDHASIWTTLIGRTEHIPDLEPFPRPIMEWTAKKVFEPTFADLRAQTIAASAPVARQPTMVMVSKSCCGNDNTGQVVELDSKSVADDGGIVPKFSLRENDFVLGDRKVGGNAQSIVKGGWLHHTSFLWDYHYENMQYLSLPSKRPDYRGDRSHDDFLLRLKTVYKGMKTDNLAQSLKRTCENEFDVQHVSLQDALKVVGGMQEWFEGKCRTKVLDL